jgi:hypothetical protein
MIFRRCVKGCIALHDTPITSGGLLGLLVGVIRCHRTTLNLTMARSITLDPV